MAAFSPARAHARALLLSDDGLTDERIAVKIGCGISTVERTCEKFAQEGTTRATREKPREREPRKNDRY